MADEPAGLLRDRVFLVALAIAVVVALGFGVIIPVLPLFARSFGVGLFEVTLVVSVFAGVRLVSNVYTGALADRIGRRRSIGWGALIVAASSLLTAGAPTYLALLALRGMGGFGSALFFNALLALVIRAVGSDRRARAVGMLQGAFLFGIAFGPSVGGLLAEPLGFRWPFVIYAVFCAGAAVVAMRFLPRVVQSRTEADADGQGDGAEGADRTEQPPGAEGADQGADRTERARDVEGAAAGGERDAGAAAAPAAQTTGFAAMWRAARQLCADPAFASALVMVAASRWAAAGMRFTLLPVYGEEVVGLGPGLVGAALTVAAVTQLALLWPAGKLADTFGRRRVAVPSYLAFACVALVVGFTTTTTAFMVLMALWGVTTGMTSVVPPAVVGDVVPDEWTGVGIGVLNTARDLGVVLGPPISGLVAGAAGYAWGFALPAALLLVGAVAGFRMRETLTSATPRGA